MCLILIKGSSRLYLIDLPIDFLISNWWLPWLYFMSKKLKLNIFIKISGKEWGNAEREKKDRDLQLWQKACRSFATFATLATSHLQFCCEKQNAFLPFCLPFQFLKVINPNLPFKCFQATPKETRTFSLPSKLLNCITILQNI